MDVPSIKGSIFEGLLADLNEAVALGRADLGELRDLLDDKDRELLDGKVSSIQWVPMRAYAAILEYLARVEGGGDRKRYLRRRGARACERLLEGIYKAYKAETGSWGKRTGEIMLGMGKLLYNFTSWSFRDAGSGLHEITCSEAEDFPDCAVDTAHGFIERYAEDASGQPVRVRSERRGRGTVVFLVQAFDARDAR
jgi:hypothetical protein